MFNLELSDRKQAKHYAVNQQVGEETDNRWKDGQTRGLMELIVDVVREGTLRGPQRADSGV